MANLDHARALSHLPAATLFNAYFRLIPDSLGSSDKTDVILSLSAALDSGLITMTDILGGLAVPAKKTDKLLGAMDSMALGRIEGLIANAGIETTAVRTVAVRAESAALSAVNDTKVLEAKVKAQTDVVLAHIDQFKVINERLGSLGAIQIDQGAVDAAVASAVAGAFKPFESAVIAAGAQDAVGSMVSSTVVATKSALDVFGVEVIDKDGRQVMVDLWDADAPAIDTKFIWTLPILQHLLLSQRTGENLWFGGEKGTGKSETARQFAARTGRAFTRINFHKYTTAEDYAGAVGLVNGETRFVKGDFLAAFTSPSTVVLLDEVTNCDPGELAVLNGFLEPNSAVNYGGSTHTRAPGVLVFAADNTLGNGDDSGRYAGTRTMNSALVDRFARVIRFTYLAMTHEIEAVMRHTGCTEKLARHVLDAVAVTRSKVETGDLVESPSIRSVVAFIRALEILTPDQAWETCISARQPGESAATLDAIKQACISTSTIAGAM